MAMIADAFVGRFLDVLQHLLTEEVQMIGGVKDELQRLQKKLMKIKAVLSDAERRRIQDEATKLWLSELKDVMYDADDIIDLCIIKAHKLGEADEELPPSSASASSSNEKGDIIDCVDFDKQPAFDHPSSKNHSIQGRHISYPNGDQQIGNYTISKVALKTTGCRPGTISLKRATREDLIRLKSFPNFGGEYITIANPLNYVNPQGAHWAVLVSDRGSYRGAHAWLEVYSLSGVELNQYSGTSIMLLSGPDGRLDYFNVISAGWLVHPRLYGDNLPRLTIFWTTDGYQHTNCYNIQCPGFIQKGSKYSLGMALNEGTLPLAIYKDKDTGDWCLATYEGNTEEVIGCWLRSIFTSLGGNAEFIEWGGAVMSALDRKSPPMGNGQFPLYGARVSQIQTIDEYNQVQDPKGRLVADRPECYNTAWFQKRPVYGWSFYYGGPGGCLG